MEINPSILNSIITNINTIDNNINTALDDLITECNSVDNNWDGLASEEYKKNFINSVRTFKTYSYELESAISIMKQSLESSVDIEKKNTELLNNSFGDE